MSKPSVSPSFAAPYGRRALIVFFALLIPLSAAAMLGICLGGPNWLVLVLMWTPALAAFAAALAGLREKGERVTPKALLAGCGFRRCRWGDALLGLLLPLVYLLVPYLVYWAIYPERFAYYGVSLLVIARDLWRVLLFGTLFSLVSALGEEIGWRGFLVVALRERFSLPKALLLSGLIWALWHLPLLIGGNYMSEAPLWYRLPAFVLCVVPIGIIASLLALRNRSVWPAALLHAAHNNYDQSVFGLLTRGDNRCFFVSETGLITIVCAWAIALTMLALELRRHAREKE